MIDKDFTTSFSDDTIYISKFSEDNEDMIFYTYMDQEIAQKLFKYFNGLRFNITNDYVKRNPIQTPIKLYESPKIAKIMALNTTNTQLVAFSINMQNKKLYYDDFDIDLQIKIKESKIGKETYKSKCVIWREKKKYENFDYIEFTIRDKSIIQEIQLQDSH